MTQLSWFDFPAQDAARAQAFYSALFGWQFDQVEDAVRGNESLEQL